MGANPGSNCELNAMIATLSTGPFGVADQAGTTNSTIVQRGTRSDGLILQPDRPASFIEAMFDRLGPKREQSGGSEEGGGGSVSVGAIGH
eukprot:SAG11_NODE_4952_length_1711_cov_3.070720_3_plen_89_part_01